MDLGPARIQDVFQLSEDVELDVRAYEFAAAVVRSNWSACRWMSWFS